MSKDYDIGLFSPFTGHLESELRKLMEHIASGAPSQWAVFSSGAGLPYDTFEEANAVFEMIAPSAHPMLMLYTRVGTSVVFRHKEPDNHE